MISVENICKYLMSSQVNHNWSCLHFPPKLFLFWWYFVSFPSFSNPIKAYLSSFPRNKINIIYPHCTEDIFVRESSSFHYAIKTNFYINFTICFFDFCFFKMQILLFFLFLYYSIKILVAIFWSLLWFSWRKYHWSSNLLSWFS